MTGGEAAAAKRVSSSSASSVSSLALREAFFNSLKEASCAATGSAARVLAMTSAAAERLWAAAEAGDAEVASAAVSRALRSGGEESSGGEEDEEGGPLPASSGFVPLRLAVVAPATGESLRDPHCAFEVVCTSRPVAKKSSNRGKEGGKEEAASAATEPAATMTLGEALLETLPTLSGGNGGPGSSAWTLDPSSSSGGGLRLRGRSARVLIAGLEVSAAAGSSDEGSSSPQLLNLLAAPLHWVHSRLCACDQFLYVVVRAPEPM